MNVTFFRWRISQRLYLLDCAFPRKLELKQNSSFNSKLFMLFIHQNSWYTSLQYCKKYRSQRIGPQRIRTMANIVLWIEILEVFLHDMIEEGSCVDRVQSFLYLIYLASVVGRVRKKFGQPWPHFKRRTIYFTKQKLAKMTIDLKKNFLLLHRQGLKNDANQKTGFKGHSLLYFCFTCQTHLKK